MLQKNVFFLIVAVFFLDVLSYTFNFYEDRKSIFKLQIFAYFTGLFFFFFCQNCMEICMNEIMINFFDFSGHKKVHTKFHQKKNTKIKVPKIFLILVRISFKLNFNSGGVFFFLKIIYNLIWNIFFSRSEKNYRLNFHWKISYKRFLTVRIAF